MNKPKVIYLSENTNSAQYRYRVQNVLEATAKSQHYQVISFLKSELPKLEKALLSASLLIVERQTAKDDIIPSLIKKAHSLGVKVIFDLDDLIFDYRDLPLLMRSTNSKNIFYWTGYFWGIRRIARLADGFLATNTFLADKLWRSFKKPVAVISNSLNLGQISASEEALKNQKPHAGFIMGYFSGSPTHAKDFRLIEPEVTQFLEKHENVRLTVVGYMDFSPRAQALLDSGRITFQKPVDYLKLQKLMTNVDVNLAPLVLNDFTNCKSELKFFEAAIVETTTIASPSFCFKKAIQHQETGLLAQPGDWFDCLELLYGDPKLNRRLAKNAKKFALENYYGKKFLTQIEEAYGTFIK